MISMKFKPRLGNDICYNCSPLKRFKTLIDEIDNENKFFETEINKTLEIQINTTTIRLTQTTTTTASKSSDKTPLAKIVFISLALSVIFTFLISIIVWVYLKIAIIIYDTCKTDSRLEKNELKSLEYRRMLTTMSRKLIEKLSSFN
jgi:hypothetical protein